MDNKVVTCNWPTLVNLIHYSTILETTIHQKKIIKKRKNKYKPTPFTKSTKIPQFTKRNTSANNGVDLILILS